MPVKIYDGSVWRSVRGSVPSDPVDVLLIAGQSNAQGKALLANLPASLSGARANVNVWDGSKFVALTAKTASSYPQAGQDWGLEMLLGELAAAKSGKPVYVVKHAVGGDGAHPPAARTPGTQPEPTAFMRRSKATSPPRSLR